ncbi:MAG: hypothetical protein ACJAWN_002142, partial [Neolewinella sp.]
NKLFPAPAFAPPNPEKQVAHNLVWTSKALVLYQVDLEGA